MNRDKAALKGHQKENIRDLGRTQIRESSERARLTEPKEESSRKALEFSKFYGGKVTVAPKVPVRSLDDFSIWYTPGVAAVSRAIEADPDLSFEYTGRWNTVAVVTDGSRVWVCRDDGQILDALRAGQLALFLAVDRVAADVDADVRAFTEDRDAFVARLVTGDGRAVSSSAAATG